MRTGGLFAVTWVGESGCTGNSQPVLAIPAQEMSVKCISGKEIEQGKDWTFSSTFLPQRTKALHATLTEVPQRGSSADECGSHYTLAERAHTCPWRVEAALPRQGILVIPYSVQEVLWDFCFPSGSPPEMARRELGIGFPWQIALLTAVLQVELQRAGPCTHRAFLPCVLYALESTTYKLENESPEEEVRTFQFCNFLWQSLRLTLQHWCFGRSLTQSRYPAVLWGTCWDEGNVSVLKLFRMFTPSESSPDLDLTHKSIQSLPNVPKSTRNKKHEGKQGRNSKGLIWCIASPFLLTPEEEATGPELATWRQGWSLPSPWLDNIFGMGTASTAVPSQSAWMLNPNMA